jgi:hypothetical protein
MDAAEVASRALDFFDLVDLVPSAPKNGYTHGTEVRRGDHVVAWIWWGGNPGVCVTGSGEDSPAVAEFLRGLPAYHRVTRADACEDWVQAGLFDRLSRVLIEYAEGNRVRINQQGDWVRHQERTLYLGSQTSVVQLVLYEKGYQVGGDPDWVRLEVRVRPKKGAGFDVAQWPPGKLFEASRWVVEALERIGWDHLQAESIGTVWRPSDQERARRALLAQYGRTLREWADELGSYEALAQELAEALAVELPEAVHT